MAESFQEQRNIPIPPEQVTWQMRAHAIGSPDRVGDGVYRGETEQSVAPMAETGTEATATTTVENPYDALLDGDSKDASASVDTAAVRARVAKAYEPTIIKAPTDAQIANAAKFGFDLSAQQKYHSPDEWAARNK